MQVGDTVKNNSLFAQTGASLLVYSIDSVLVRNLYHKRFRIADSWNIPTNVYIIEGIGSTLGGFYQYDYFEQYYELLCVTSDSLTIYPDTNMSCEMIYAIDNSFLSFSNRISIYPNPFDNYLKIVAKISIKEVRIYDLYLREITNFSYENSTIYFNSNLIAGVYIINIKDQRNQIHISKILKL